MKIFLDNFEPKLHTHSMKENLHTSDRKTVNSLDAMKALAHPARIGILSFLLSGGPKTATECSEHVDESPSACSYHLRELERFGFVERTGESEDGRARPWQATAAGFSVGDDWTDDTMPARVARQAITRAELDENRRLVMRFFEAEESAGPDWKSAVDFHTYELTVTPQELQHLNSEVAKLLRPYRSTEREIRPEAAPVHVVYQAFPRT